MHNKAGCAAGAIFLLTVLLKGTTTAVRQTARFILGSENVVRHGYIHCHKVLIYSKISKK